MSKVRGPGVEANSKTVCSLAIAHNGHGDMFACDSCDSCDFFLARLFPCNRFQWKRLFRLNKMIKEAVEAQ